jgi:hypothetical protein
VDWIKAITELINALAHFAWPVLVVQFSAAVAATTDALMIHDGANHQLVSFGKVAWLYVGWAVIALWLASGIRRGQWRQPLAQVHNVSAQLADSRT